MRLRGVGWGRGSGFLLVMAALLSMQGTARAGDQCTPATTLHGVDLNPDGDGTLDWGSSGLSFGVIKATQGTYYTDSDFASNWAALKSANVIRGAYHFFDATLSGVDQANYFLAAIGTLEPGDLPPLLDIECPVSGESDCLGNGSSGAASSAQITQGMNDFLNTVKTATGLTPVVYSYGSWFSDNNVDTTGLDAYPLWLAAYTGTGCFDVPSPWTVATFWQYDSSGSLSGVNVDDDYFLGSLAQLMAFTSKGSLPIDGGAGATVDAGQYGTCTVSGTGKMGDCIDTATCSAQGGTSTADLCPGPANIECCVGLPTNEADAGSPPTGSGSGSSNPGSGTGGAGTGTGGGSHDGGAHPGSGSDVDAGKEPHPSLDAADPSNGGGCSVVATDAAPDAFAVTGALAWLLVGARRKRRPA